MTSANTATDLKRRLSSLTRDQRCLLFRKCFENGYSIDQLPIATLREEWGSLAPLSAAQKKLWVLENLHPGSRFNRINMAFDIKGDLSAEILQAAINDIVSRHSILRVTFPDQARPVQSSNSSLSVDLIVRELGEAPGFQLAQAREEFETLPFDLRRGPLFRVLLLRRMEQNYLFLSFHHLIADGWSLDVLARDISRAYDARRAGVAPAWQTPCVGFSNFAHWETELAEAGIFALYAEKNGACAPLCAEPTAMIPDYISRSSTMGEGGIIRRYLGTEGTDAIKQFSQARGTTPFNVAFAATAIALARFCDCEGIVLGIVRANRGRPETHHAVGLFVNIVTACLEVDPNAPFAAVLREVERITSHTAASEFVPFDYVHRQSRTSEKPFNCVLIYQNATQETLSIRDMEITEILPDSTGIYYDLVFVWRITSSGLMLEIEYAKDLYHPGTVTRLCDCMIAVARASTNNPESSVKELGAEPTSGQNDRNVKDYGTLSPSSHEAPIDQVYSVCRRIPESLAIETETEQISYSGLAVQVSRLARFLLGAGVISRQRVGVIAEAGFDGTLVALAISRIGGCFVFLDSRSEAEYNISLLKRIKCDIIVMSERLHFLSNSYMKSGIKCIQLKTKTSAAPVAPPPFARLEGSDSMYIACTSGSTGNPKCIVQSHRSFAQFLEWQAATFDFRSGTRVAMWAPLTFDACYTEIFGALASGSTLCISDYAKRNDPRYICDFLIRKGIEYFLTVPSFLSVLIGILEGTNRVLPNIRYICVSGEILNAELANRVRLHLPNVKLYNLYGPTECVLATFYRVDRDFCPEERVPVGRAIDGRIVRLHNRFDEPSPRGAIGEVVVRSDYLTDGYFGEGPSHSGRFSQYNSESRPLVYKTGDLGRVAEDGTLYFLGRRDRQIKVMGCRVELEAIEAVLLSHPSVEECAVIDIYNRFKDATLAAFYTATSDAASTPTRKHFKGRLPLASIPSLFIQVNRIPRSSTGKVDRNALRDLHVGATETKLSNDEIGERVAAIWAEILGREVDRDVRFFEAGGTSIQSMRLQIALNKEFSCEIDLVDIFSHPTINDMIILAHSAGQGMRLAISSARARAQKRLNLADTCELGNFDITKWKNI